MVNGCNCDAVCNALMVLTKQTFCCVAVNQCVHSNSLLINFVLFNLFEIFAWLIAHANSVAVNRNVLGRTSAIFVELATFALALQIIHNIIVSKLLFCYTCVFDYY